MIPAICNFRTFTCISQTDFCMHLYVSMSIQIVQHECPKETINIPYQNNTAFSTVEQTESGGDRTATNQSSMMSQDLKVSRVLGHAALVSSSRSRRKQLQEYSVLNRNRGNTHGPPAKKAEPSAIESCVEDYLAGRSSAGNPQVRPRSETARKKEETPRRSERQVYDSSWVGTLYECPIIEK
jgi:hypothetical protein